MEGLYRGTMNIEDIWELYLEIKHGDEEHQKWLYDKVADFIERKQTQEDV